MNNITVDGVVLQQLVRPGRPARRPHRRRADLARGHRAGAGAASRRTTCARATSSAPASTPSRAAARTRSRARSTTASATTAIVGTEARRAGVQSGHVRPPATPASGSAVRSSRTSCSSSATSRTRRTRGRSRRSRQPGRRAGGGQHHARAGLRPERAQRVPVEQASTTTPARSRTSAKNTPAKPFLVKGDYNLNDHEQGQLPLQPAELELRRQPVELVVARASAARRSARTS